MAEIGSVSLFFIFFFAIVFTLGLLYWIKVLSKKISPNFKWWFKYHVLRRKHNEDIVRMILEDIENGVDENEMFKAILMSGKATQSQAKELKYIYKELKRRYEK